MFGRRILQVLKEIAADVKAIRQQVAPQDVASLKVTIDPPTKQGDTNE